MSWLSVRSLKEFYREHYREHYKGILTALLFFTSALSAGAAPVNQQGEPIVALVFIFLSCIFAVLTAVFWKGSSKYSTLTWIIKIVGLIGFFLWSVFSVVLTWRNKPKDKWTNFTAADATAAQSFVASLLDHWQFLLASVAIVAAFLIGRSMRKQHNGSFLPGLRWKGTGTVSTPCPDKGLHQTKIDDKDHVKDLVVICGIHYWPIEDGLQPSRIDFQFVLLNMSLFEFCATRPACNEQRDPFTLICRRVFL